VGPFNKNKHIEINYILPKMECIIYVLVVEKDFNKNYIRYNKVASLIS